MWFFSCCGGPKQTHFRSRAVPALRKLQSEYEALKGQGQTYAATALAKKLEAARHYREGSTFYARVTAMEVRTNEEMAERYIEILASLQTAIREINRLWAAHDKITSASATALDLHDLGIAQGEELTGSDVQLSLDQKIDAANKMLEDFLQVVERTDNEIKKMTGGSDDGDDLLKQVQMWEMGQIHAPPQLRDMTPDQLEMARD
jgi:hypothetical protein